MRVALSALVLLLSTLALRAAEPDVLATLRPATRGSC